MKLIQKIANGGISEVYKVQDGNYMYAFKTLKYIYTYNREAINRIRKEYDILSKIQHQQIVKCYNWTNIDNREGILMEYIRGIPLKQAKINKEWEGFKFIREIIDFLQNLNPAVIHNDISGNNIMIDNFGRIKLIDFSSSFYSNEERIIIAKENTDISTEIKNVFDIDIVSLKNLIKYITKDAKW